MRTTVVISQTAKYSISLAAVNMVDNTSNKRSRDEMENDRVEVPVEEELGAMVNVEEPLNNDGNMHAPITQDEIQVEIVDNQPSPSLTPFLVAIEKMKVPELKEGLKSRGMNTKGKKLELKNRLLHAVNEGVCVLDANEIATS